MSKRVASEPLESVPAVRVRVELSHTSAARVPKPVSVREPLAHTRAGTERMYEASEVEALFTTEPMEVEAARTALFVLLFMTAPSEEEAVRTAEFVLVFTAEVTPAVAELVFVFTAVVIELDAVCTSVRVASEPEERPAPVSVRVELSHTSAARVPKPVSVREVYAHTFAGMLVIEVLIEESVEPSEVEAVRMALLVLVFTPEVTPAVAELVLVLTPEVIEEDAVRIFALILEVALLISLFVASEPLSSVASVRVRVA